MQKSAAREREEEKRRLQAEMRRREQELLSKIKEQQRELESMKQEKGKVMVMIFSTLIGVAKVSFPLLPLPPIIGPHMWVEPSPPLKKYSPQKNN